MLPGCSPSFLAPGRLEPLPKHHPKPWEPESIPPLSPTITTSLQNQVGSSSPLTTPRIITILSTKLLYQFVIFLFPPLPSFPRSLGL